MGAFSKDNLQRFAADLGLDTGQFNQCLNDGKYAEVVQQETFLGQQAGVRGTPAIFVNGQLVEGGADYQVLREAVQAELAK